VAESRLFVYGTLRSGERNDIRSFGEVRFAGNGQVAGSIYDLGAYPVYLPSPAGVVEGEVFVIADRLLSDLDLFEGHPDLFRRTRMEVEMSGGTRVEAWVYVYQGDPGPAPRIAAGDWLKR
jgi:gamma-glutamylcyclotransferase (GGCT)/AIG2-like uncharacterized protein YtfP